jgi:hypothetical protein
MKNVFHENVLPFYGISTSVSKFCLVFPWYENGTVMDYLEVNPDADRYNLVSKLNLTARRQYLPEFHNSYPAQSVGCASCMTII